MKNLILIDGNSLLFRAYFAMRPMITSKGVHTQGIYAFINMLNKILNDYNPEYIGVAFDMKEKTFRHEKYSEYKAGRLATPIELLTEIPLMHDVLNAMNIKVLEMPRYEADDLIGTVAKRASKDGLQTIVISGDKDELQLVDENTKVLINKKGMSEFDLYDEQAMMERYSLTPKQFIDLKGLMGDKSDNIPGIAGVGEKKGIALLQEYGSLESVLEHADEIPGKLGENVRENIESARLSKWLATIDVDAPIEFEWSELEYIEPNYDELVKVYTELEFSTFIKRLNTNIESETAISTVDFSNDIASIKEITFNDFLSIVNSGDEVIIDIDSDNSHTGKPSISSVSLYSADKNIYSFKELTELEIDVCLDALCEKEYKLNGFDLKPMLYSLLCYTNKTLHPNYDIAIAEYLIDSNRNKYLLDKMLLRYTECVAPEGYSNKEKLYFISQIITEQRKALENQGLMDLFAKCEMPLVLTLAKMEHEGITVNPETLMSIGNEIDDRINILEEKIFRASGLQFNINSPKQLGDVLFNKLMIPYPKAVPKTGTYSTAADILDKLKFDYEIVADVLEYRKNSKLKSTYIDGLLSLIGTDRKIHPHFQQTVAATGRLSCTEPNLQNIPVRDDYGRLIRKAFVTSKSGNVFTGSDYSQIELRIMAALSGDAAMIQDFKDGKDIHKATASRVFNIPEDEVKAIDRSRAKAVNFGVIYGMSGFGLSENLKITRAESEKYINDYFEKHTSVKSYLDSLIEQGEKEQEVKTYYGRVRKIPEFASRKYMEKELAKRLAMNTPIQGTAADIIKFAMNSVSKELENQGLESKLILQIHDELIVEGPETESEKVRDILYSCMRNAADLSVELICDIHSGKTWYELK